MLGKIVVGRDALGAPLVQLSEYGVIVYREIEETPLHYKDIMIDKFIVMPNHIHMIIMINRDNVAPYNRLDTNYHCCIEKENQ